MRRILFWMIIACLAVGSLWLWDRGQLYDAFQQYVENGEFVTLEARYTPEQIMDTHRQELLVDHEHSFKNPELKFHPYLLMEVKYTQSDNKTREGVILWSLMDGEMVLDTDTWEKTHGFEDAINARATPNDFKIVNALAKRNGSMTYDQLQGDLNVEREILKPWIDSALDKHLIIQKGHELKLHFQNPRILVSPQTIMNQWFVTQPYHHAQRVSKKYQANQIRNIAQSAFGKDFAIRQMTEVFLPIYSIEVMNPDGSVLTTYWNALNGQRIFPKYLAQIN